MTPDEISKLSNQQLNELIAVKREQKPSPGRPTTMPKNWTGVTGSGFRLWIPVDFCSDWRYAGELLEEMPFQTKLINYEDEGNGRMFWTCTVTNLLNMRVVAHSSAATPTRAIAEAWYLMEEK